MEAIGITTRWAGSPLSFARLRRALGLDLAAVFLLDGVREREIDELRTFLPRGAVAAIALFAPLPRLYPPGAACPFRLGSLHPEERRDALNQGLRAIEIADRADIPVVVAPPGVLDSASGKVPRRQRAEAASRHLDSFLSALSRLLDQAARYHRRLAVTLGGPPEELPDVAEARRCLEEFRGSPLCLWADAERHGRYRATGGPDPDALRGDLRGLVAGVTVRDGAAAAEDPPLGPPAGAPAPASRLWALDLAPEAGEEDLVAARDALRTRVLGPETPPFEPYALGGGRGGGKG